MTAPINILWHKIKMRFSWEHRIENIWQLATIYFSLKGTYLNGRELLSSLFWFLSRYTSMRISFRTIPEPVSSLQLEIEKHQRGIDALAKQVTNPFNPSLRQGLGTSPQDCTKIIPSGLFLCILIFLLSSQKRIIQYTYHYLLPLWGSG